MPDPSPKPQTPKQHHTVPAVCRLPRKEFRRQVRKQRRSRLRQTVAQTRAEKRRLAASDPVLVALRQTKKVEAEAERLKQQDAWEAREREIEAENQARRLVERGQEERKVARQHIQDEWSAVVTQMKSDGYEHPSEKYRPAPGHYGPKSQTGESKALEAGRIAAAKVLEEMRVRNIVPLGTRKPVSHGPSTSALHSLTAEFKVQQKQWNCAFYMQTGSCRLGPVACMRVHPEPTVKTTLLIPNMSTYPPTEQDAHSQVQISEMEYIVEFYQDVYAEFSRFPGLKALKVCQNKSPHLRGNVYAQYASEEAASRAQTLMHNRYYGGRRLTCIVVPELRWDKAICAAFLKGKCKSLETCSLLHPYTSASIRAIDRQLTATAVPDTALVGSRSISRDPPSQTNVHLPRDATLRSSLPVSSPSSSSAAHQSESPSCSPRQHHHHYHYHHHRSHSSSATSPRRSSHGTSSSATSGDRHQSSSRRKRKRSRSPSERS
ncbi:hypothetical protein DFS34DRAFT_599269 [Phlyctochytrium arcticum]|nr:hypothetical protein DFS34DRAFT_599269 [Phlyctochytrium arcticum]